jgi:hypothetical protein
MATMKNKNRWICLFILPQVLFAVLAYATQGATLITILNTVVFASAAGVCLAYSPAVWDAMTAARSMDRSDWLCMGVFVSWFSIVVARSWSIIWRVLGRPPWLLDSDLISYSLYMAIWAAIFHLAAPGGIDDRVPPQRWINIGIAVSIFLLVAIGSAYYFEAFGLD